MKLRFNKLTNKTKDLLEKAALLNPGNAYAYAAMFLENRFPQGEDLISKSYFWSYCYSMNVISGRFVLGEESLFKNLEYHSKYHKFLEYENLRKNKFHEKQEVNSD
jgi:hypothetical protein